MSKIDRENDKINELNGILWYNLEVFDEAGNSNSQEASLTYQESAENTKNYYVKFLFFRYPLTLQMLMIVFQYLKVIHIQ